MHRSLVSDHTTLKAPVLVPITEVKQRRAKLVLGWVTAWEYLVLLTFLVFYTSTHFDGAAVALCSSD